MPKIPTFKACHFEGYFDVICFHAEADDSFNVSGTGVTRAEAFAKMLEDLYEHCVDKFETDEEDAAFLAAIEAAQSAARIQALASDNLLTQRVPF